MGAAIDRTTLRVFDSVETALYSPTDFLIIEKGRDNSDYKDLVSRQVPTKYWRIVSDRVSEMDASQKAAVDAAALPNLKDGAISKIEAATQAELARGFEHPPGSGVRFSLDQHARTLIIGMILARDSLPYPVLFNSLDQRTTLSLRSADDVNAFFGSAVLTVLTAENAATAKKELVRAGDLSAAAMVAEAVLSEK